MNSRETILLFTLFVVTASLICIILFYPPTKDRCMKAAKKKDWCIASLPASEDGYCVTGLASAKQMLLSRKREEFKSINPRFSPFTGGYKESINGNISNTDFLSNTMNHNLITRQMKALWPEFSWPSNGRAGVPEEVRIHQRFATDISRIGYDDTGKIYNIICPQTGGSTPLGVLCAEVRVDEVRGFVDEEAIVDPSRGDWVNADVKVTGHVWFENSDIVNPNPLMSTLIEIAHSVGLRSLPFSKETAIKLPTYNGRGANREGERQGVSNRYLRLVPGYNPTFTPPSFTLHENTDSEAGQAVAACYLVARIGEIDTTGLTEGGAAVHQFILNLFNTARGNMLKPGNDLCWNVNLDGPESVDLEEYENHNTFWRRSLGDVHSHSHDGKTEPRHDDGSDYVPPGLSASDVASELATLTFRYGASRLRGLFGSGDP